MNRIIIGLLLILAVFIPFKAHAQVTTNVFERVLNVRVNAGTDHAETATAFTIDVDGREYLITAKHVVQDLRDKGRIDIFMDNHWSPLTVDVFRCDDPVDIAVLVPPHQLTVNFPLPFDDQDLEYGQETYFLGFPYGIQSPLPSPSGPYPLALVKRGTFSGQVAIDTKKKQTMVFLDGYNNPGFSGGPIVYRDLSQGSYVMKLYGVVSGFMPEIVPAMKEHDIKSPRDAGVAARAQPWKIRRRADGTYFEYVDSGTFVALNTGIVTGFFIGPAIDVIHQHPIGPVVRSLPGNNPAGSP